MPASIRQAFRNKAFGRVFPAVPIPWTADGRMHEAAQEKYVEYLTASGVGGAAVWAHTGRGLHIPWSEKIKVMKSWRQGFSDGRLLIAGVGALPDRSLSDAAMKAKFMEETRNMADDAVSCGADAFLVYAPIAWRDAPDQDEKVLEYHQMLSEYGKPLVLFYLYREAGGINYSFELLKQLLALPQAAAIKIATLDSVTTFQDVAAIIKAEQPDLTLITGEDRMVGYTYMMGAKAALIGMGAACTKPQVSMANAWFSADHAKFLHASAKVDAFSEVTFAKPLDRYIIRMLWSLVAEGIIPEEAANDCMGLQLDRSEIGLIKSTIENLGWMDWSDR